MAEKIAIYLDHNAGAPLLPRISQKLTENQGEYLLRSYGNSSSLHAQGRWLSRELLLSRQWIAKSWGPQVRPDQVHFAASGSDANLQVVTRAFARAKNRGLQSPEWILTGLEHDSVIRLTHLWQSWGGRVRSVAVSPQGQVLSDSVVDALCDETALFSLIWVHNETGVLTDFGLPFWTHLKEKKIWIHLDGAQAWGKMKLDLHETPADGVTFSGYKIGALQGSGAYWLRDPSEWDDRSISSVQSGERVPGAGAHANFSFLPAVSLGIAAQECVEKSWGSDEDTRTMRALRDEWESELVSQISGVKIWCQDQPRICNTSLVQFSGVHRSELLMQLDLRGIQASSGAACRSGIETGSRALQCMGSGVAASRGLLRVSLGRNTTKAELEYLTQQLLEILPRLRSASSPPVGDPMGLHSAQNLPKIRG